MLDDPLVEALEARREERQWLLLGKLLHQLLIELASLRRQRDHPVAGSPAVDRVESGRDDVDPENHPRAAAVRLVVDLASRERRRVAVAEQAELELGTEHGSDRTLLGEPGERVWDEREDIDAQGGRRLAIGCESRLHKDSTSLEIDLLDARVDERQREPRVELEDVVGGAARDLGHQAETWPPSSTSRPTSWKA